MLGGMNIDLDRRTPPQAPPAACEHGWVTESRHATSQGVIVYVRCVRCRTHRVELASPETAMPARALSRPVRGAV